MIDQQTRIKVYEKIIQHSSKDVSEAEGQMIDNARLKLMAVVTALKAASQPIEVALHAVSVNNGKPAAAKLLDINLHVEKLKNEIGGFLEMLD